MENQSKCKNCKGRGRVTGGADKNSKNIRTGLCFYCLGTGVKNGRKN